MHTRDPSGIMLATLLTAILMAAVRPAQARVGQAEVREGPRGGPCFTISPREERLGTSDFQAVSVSDGRRQLWTMRMPPGRSFPLSFSMCVPYGGRVAALPRSASAALEAGRVYTLHIDARPRSHAAAPSYEARFCLARQRDGSLLVHQIVSSDRESHRLYGCLPPEE
ncbi:hypothetical protein [Massilia sp. 9096]|uniref:hypothetical protein n=1 Tax=Massilia sp. 9096 TaxID=1500894 RepID=UPI00056D6E51|nr:hypothetical protein [Massilia sp. 9096]